MELSTIESAIVKAVTALQGQYRNTRTGRTSHGVHTVYSGLFSNVVKAAGSKDAAIATLDGLVARGVLYRKPSRGGFSLATTPFPVAPRTSPADAFFGAK